MYVVLRETLNQKVADELQEILGKCRCLVSRRSYLFLPSK